jgi:ribonuclease HII
MTERIIVGADEAARGLIIGPMVISAVAINPQIGELFRRNNVRDSKKYTSTRALEKHAQVIKKKALAWDTQVLSAKTLNNFYQNGMTMDETEAYAFYRALEQIIKKESSVTVFQVDNFQATKKLQQLMKKNKKTRTVKLVVQPRAEDEYIVVSAGSVLARAESHSELEKIRKKFGDFGSGSTNDKKTIRWLKNYFEKHQRWPEEIIRTYWKTIPRIEREIKEDLAKR